VHDFRKVECITVYRWAMSESKELTCCDADVRLTRQTVKGNDSAVRQELEDAEMKVEQCKVRDWQQ